MGVPAEIYRNEYYGCKQEYHKDMVCHLSEFLDLPFDLFLITDTKIP